MSRIRYSRLIACCLLSVACCLPSAIAQEATKITLINGAAIEGRVLAVSEAGLKFKAGRSTKTYPWYALSAGTRFKYDETYRMNIDGYLAGSDPSLLTNAPDPEYDPLNPKEVKREKAPSGVSASQSLNFNAYLSPNEVTPNKTPAFRTVSLNKYTINALQYGPASGDLLLTGFSSDTPPRLLLLDMNKSDVVKESSTDRTIDGVDYYSYPRKTLSARVDDVTVEQRIQWLVQKDKVKKRYVHAEVDLSRGAISSSFVLTGRPRGFESADTMLIPKAILVEPSMSFTITIEDDKTFLVGKVRVGRLSLLPRAGMDLTLKVRVVDGNGREVLNKKASFNAGAGPGDYPVKLDISAFNPGGQYTLAASISLGALLGDVEHRETFIMPDAMKL